jgi:hypothetical protein
MQSKKCHCLFRYCSYEQNIITPLYCKKDNKSFFLPLLCYNSEKIKEDKIERICGCLLIYCYSYQYENDSDNIDCSECYTPCCCWNTRNDEDYKNQKCFKFLFSPFCCYNSWYKEVKYVKHSCCISPFHCGYFKTQQEELISCYLLSCYDCVYTKENKEYLKGNTKEVDLNNYIFLKKLKYRTNNMIYSANKENINYIGPEIQIMTNEDIKDEMINEKQIILLNKIEEYEISEFNLLKLIKEF